MVHKLKSVSHFNPHKESIMSYDVGFIIASLIGLKGNFLADLKMNSRLLTLIGKFGGILAQERNPFVNTEMFLQLR